MTSHLSSVMIDPRDGGSTHSPRTGTPAFIYIFICLMTRPQLKNSQAICIAAQVMLTC